MTALSDGTVYELGREPFLAAVLGHVATERRASRAADALLAGDVSARTAGDAATADDAPAEEDAGQQIEPSQLDDG